MSYDCDPYIPVHHEQSGLSKFKNPPPGPQNITVAAAAIHSTEFWPQNFQTQPTFSASLLHQNSLSAQFLGQNNTFHAFITPHMGLNTFGILNYPHSKISTPVMNNNGSPKTMFNTSSTHKA